MDKEMYEWFFFYKMEIAEDIIGFGSLLLPLPRQVWPWIQPFLYA